MILIYEYGDTVSKCSFAVGVRTKCGAGLCKTHKKRDRGGGGGGEGKN
jgi:hypothetical protein